MLSLLALPAVAGAHRTFISRSGAIGALRLNVSSPADIVRDWGPPGYEASGNMLGTESSAFPDYDLLGYGCRSISGTTECSINFYVNERNGLLESFVTSARGFTLFGGVHVGMSADLAARREKQRNVAGCGQFIHLSTPSLSLNINTAGGTPRKHGDALYVSGGRVASIAIDDKRFGVGALFC